MSICTSHKPCKPIRTIKRALRAVGFSTAAALIGLSAAASPTWANASLQAGQVWSGSYRCAAISGRASLEVTRFEPIAERPGWQRIEATLTIEESGRRAVARFAANNPTRDAFPPSSSNDRLRQAQLAANNRPNAFLLGLTEWVEQPAGVEFQRLRIEPMRDAGGVARIGVNVHGRPECIVNGVNRFAFIAEPARPDRTNPAASPPAPGHQATGGPGGTGVEMFGIRLGSIANWPECSFRQRYPCISRKLGLVELSFGIEARPAMIHLRSQFSYQDLSLRLVDERVEGLSFEIWREDEHLQAFEQKFGASKKELVPMHNDQGGRWTGFVHRWDVSGTSIQIDCTRFERVCSVEVETPVWRQQRQQDKDRRQKL